MGIKKIVETLVAAVTSTDVIAVERELRRLEQRRAQLAESLDAATHNAINASAARRDLIIANRDQRTLDEANAKVRSSGAVAFRSGSAQLLPSMTLLMSVWT
jgi:ABC-type phosphate transport system auxiliary subunit